MPTLDQAIRDLCKAHDLTAISINFNRYGVHAYAHWSDSGGQCAGRDGRTAAEALANTIREANELRAAAPSVPDLALSEADMAQLVAEDEAADRREALWESCKELAERHGEAE